eukprot:Opistho-2@26912
MAAVHEKKDPSVKERWVCIYPVYLNSTKTVPEGRRVSRERGVRDPTCNEIRDVCNSLKLECAVEPHKCYPRDFTQQGRVRVHLRNADGSPVKPQIANRKTLFAAVAFGIQKISGRAADAAAAASEQASQVSQPTAARGGKKPKKGKK